MTLPSGNVERGKRTFLVLKSVLKHRLIHRVTLVRRTLPGVFSFEYELPTPYNVSRATKPPKTLDLENELPSVLQFEIGPNDIGGTLSVQLSLDHSKVGQRRTQWGK